jgi:ubiquitin-protein ligase
VQGNVTPSRLELLRKWRRECTMTLTLNSRVQGNVMPSRFEVLRAWRRDYTMETILMELRREMSSSANRKLAQPQEGTQY